MDPNVKATRCFTVRHPREHKLCIWRVEVDRPVEQGGPFYHEFKGEDAVFYGAQMANKWQRKLDKANKRE